MYKHFIYLILFSTIFFLAYTFIGLDIVIIVGLAAILSKVTVEEHTCPKR